MIFVDTGAWFAMAVRNDPDHPAAVRWLQQNREALITTDHVLAETATLIRTCDKATAVPGWWYKLRLHSETSAIAPGFLS